MENAGLQPPSLHSLSGFTVQLSIFSNAAQKYRFLLWTCWLGRQQAGSEGVSRALRLDNAVSWESLLWSLFWTAERAFFSGHRSILMVMLCVWLITLFFENQVPIIWFYFFLPPPGSLNCVPFSCRGAIKEKIWQTKWQREFALKESIFISSYLMRLSGAPQLWPFASLGKCCGVSYGTIW